MALSKHSSVPTVGLAIHLDTTLAVADKSHALLATPLWQFAWPRLVLTVSGQ